MAQASTAWDALASKPSPAWYLDPLAAEQKRQVHQGLVRRWTRGLQIRRALKTDLFEEANGVDAVLFDLFPADVFAVGIDVAWQSARRARTACASAAVGFMANDVCRLAIRSESVDVVVSTSTLDHLESPEEFKAALGEMMRVLRPGGVAVITTDNPSNPLYGILHWMSGRGWAPFSLGYTPALPMFVEHLREVGFEVVASDTVIHNVRGLSTLLFLGLRRVLGKRADGMIRGVLSLSAGLGRLPSRRFTACFLAACARKPDRRP